MKRIEGFVEIEAPVERVFTTLADFENYPRWMSNITHVRKLDARKSEWVIAASPPTNGEVKSHWLVEMLIFEPDRRLIWRATSASTATNCEAVLQETRHGSTLLRMVRGYQAPSSVAANIDTQSFDKHQERQLEEDLTRLKRIVEDAYAASSMGSEPRIATATQTSEPSNQYAARSMDGSDIERLRDEALNRSQAE